MATLSDKSPNNLPGRFYVDTSCIDCGLCPENAPLTFRRDDTAGQSYVWQQPTTETEVALAEEAMASCPTESIGIHPTC
jgi:ferredoxin